MNSDASSIDTSGACLIGLDWGTSSLRAFLINERGEVLHYLQSPDGIMQVSDGDFEGVLTRLLDTWAAWDQVPMIASGMITSRNGWQETPYLHVPIGATQLAGSLTHSTLSNSASLHFITGVTDQHHNAPDVMRGEETQITGAVETGLIDGVCVMPGTHSKWVTVRDGLIKNFETVMTGEVFHALRHHTILGKLAQEGEFSEEGFRQGVAAGIDAGPRLLQALFRVRTLPLFEKIAEDRVADYLSGLLIGSEIQGATSNRPIPEESVTIVGREDLANRYRIALQVAGIQSTYAPGNIVARGHFRIARAAGLLS